MRSASILKLSWLLLLAICLAPAASAADFTQPERDADFIRACRRQDSEMKAYFSGQLPDTIGFYHKGEFQAVVHRDGLKRAISLVPVKQLKYADAEALRSAARQKGIPVGILKIAYGNMNPFIIPGTHLLVFDGSRLRLFTVDGLEINRIKTEVGLLPAQPEADPVIGDPVAMDYSICNITPEGTLQLYIQQVDAKGAILKNESGYAKLFISAAIPGLVTDDDSPERELAQPEEEEKESKAE